MSMIERAYWKRVYHAGRDAGLTRRKSRRMAYDAIASIKGWNGGYTD